MIEERSGLRVQEEKGRKTGKEMEGKQKKGESSKPGRERKRMQRSLSKTRNHKGKNLPSISWLDLIHGNPWISRAVIFNSYPWGEKAVSDLSFLN